MPFSHRRTCLPHSTVTVQELASALSAQLQLPFPPYIGKLHIKLQLESVKMDVVLGGVTSATEVASRFHLAGPKERKRMGGSCTRYQVEFAKEKMKKLPNLRSVPRANAN